MIFISINSAILEIEANPLITSTLFFLRRNLTPDDNCFDASLDLFTIFSISKVISPLILKPKSLNLSRFFLNSLTLRRDFVGMQPQFKQIPPNSLFSINVTFKPN